MKFIVLSAVLAAASVNVAFADAGQTILRCAPLEGDRSGVESVVITKVMGGCPQTGNVPHCFAIFLRYVAEVTRNDGDFRPVENYNVMPQGSGLPGAGEIYQGEGFELNLGPVVPHPIAHLTISSPGNELTAQMTCK